MTALGSSPLRNLDKGPSPYRRSPIDHLLGLPAAAAVTVPRVRDPIPLTEDQIHLAVAARLRLARACFWHTPNGGKRHVVEANRLKAMGTMAGVPDLQIVMGGRSYFLELKRERGVLSPAQTATIERLREAGCAVAVTYGLDHALAQLEAWGVLKVRAQAT